MHGQDRFERRSLRDVLVAQGVLSSEIADEIMSSARENHERFGAAVVDSGHMTSWDLAKIVATTYQLPVLPLAGFQFDADLMGGLPAATCYQYLVVPVGRFGRTWSLAVVEPPARECLASLEDACGSSLFFFVAEVPEVKRLLRDHVKMVDASADKGWEQLFDAGDRNVLERLGTEE
jgi:hypothetical protein